MSDTDAAPALPDTASAGDVIAAAIAEGEAATHAMDSEEAPPQVDAVESPESDDAAPPSPDPSEAAESSEASSTPAPALSEGQRWAASADLPEDLRVTFNENGRELSMGIDDLVKHTQRAKHLGRQEHELRRELKEARGMRDELEQWKGRAENTDTILTEILRGDDRLLQQMRAKYREALGPDGRLPQHNAPPQAQQSPADDEAAAIQAAGERAIQEILIPHAEALADVYGADTQEVAIEMGEMIEQLGEEGVSWEEVERIMNERVVLLLEDLGYEASGEVPRFDPSPWQSAAQDNARRTSGRRGLTPRSARDASMDPRDRRIAELEAQLQEQATSAAPSVGTRARGASGKTRGKTADPAASSELLDLDEAGSYAEILEAMNKQLGG